MNPAPLQVVVYRAERPAFDVRELARAGASGCALAVVAFVGDGVVAGEELDGVPVIPLETWRAVHPELPCLVVALDAAERRAQAERVRAAGGAVAGLGGGGPGISSSLVLGEGAILGAGALYVSRARIGRHAIVMRYVSIGHDCVVGDFATIHPAAVISGYVVLGEDVVVGAGSVIVNGSEQRALQVGRGARIAAGAVVTKSVPALVLVTGNPGRVVAASHPFRFDHEE